MKNLMIIVENGYIYCDDVTVLTDIQRQVKNESLTQHQLMSLGVKFLRSYDAYIVGKATSSTTDYRVDKVTTAIPTYSSNTKTFTVMGKQYSENITSRSSTSLSESGVYKALIS